MARFQPIPKTSSPMPAANDATTSRPTLASTPRTTIGMPSSETATMPTSRGRGRATRSSTRVAASAPAASAESTHPQAWRPIVSPARAGPRVSHAPAPIAFSTPNPATTTQSHVVPRKSRQPSRSPASVEAAEALPTGGSAAGEAVPAHREEEQGREQPGGGIGEDGPPRPDRDDEQGAQAGPGDGGEAPRGREQRVGGLELLARDGPPAIARSRIIHRSARPVMSSTAVAPWASALVRFEACSTSERSNRSASTPPRSSTTTIGTVRAASTCPSVVAEPPRSSTAKAIATEAAVRPSRLTVRDARYQENAGCRSGPKEVRLVTSRP